jgi:hypothetical protein
MTTTMVKTAAGADRAPAEEWGSLATVCRLLGRGPNAVKSIAIAGAIRTRCLPGTRPVYSLADAATLAAVARS